MTRGLCNNCKTPQLLNTNGWCSECIGEPAPRKAPMKGRECPWGCGGQGHNYVCTPNPTAEHTRSVVMMAEVEEELRIEREYCNRLYSLLSGYQDPPAPPPRP